MKLLILGGTRFLGLHLLAAAVARKHEVCLFNRGNHPSPPLPQVETIHGDRNADLSKLKGRRWDAVIDTCGLVPRAVKASAQFLSGSVSTYVFISSQSVYADLSLPGVDEDAEVKTLTTEELERANEIDSSGQGSAASYGQMYGGLKALCEQGAETAMAGRVLNIRPGLIVGPYDYTDRFTYWVTRVAKGGEVLAPGRPEYHVQFIDVRDLAEWTIKMLEGDKTGLYNANGEAGKLTIKNLLDQCQALSESEASLTWAPEAFLLRHNVAPWSEMPLWLPDEVAPHLKGFMFVDCSKAVNAGLEFRPLTETIRDTLSWYKANRVGEPFSAGISSDKEQELLNKLRTEPEHSSENGP
jgi:2'-hydroxyisoflavone reductase